MLHTHTSHTGSLKVHMLNVHAADRPTQVQPIYSGGPFYSAITSFHQSPALCQLGDYKIYLRQNNLDY